MYTFNFTYDKEKCAGHSPYQNTSLGRKPCIQVTSSHVVLFVYTKCLLLTYANICFPEASSIVRVFSLPFESKVNKSLEIIPLVPGVKC